MKAITILFLFISAILLSGLVSQNTSAYLVDVETSVNNSLTAFVEEVPPCGKFLVADNGRSVDYIYQYDSSGTYVDRFLLPEENHKPQGVASICPDVYVLDKVDKKVYQYTISDGQLLTVSRELKGMSGHELAASTGLSIDGDEMWVVGRSGGHDEDEDCNNHHHGDDEDCNNRHHGNNEDCDNHHHGDEDDCNGGYLLRYSLSEAFADNGQPLNAVQEIQLTSGNGNPGGLAIGANYLYVVDSAKDRFYRYPRTGGTVTVSKKLKQTDGSKIGKPTGAMYDGTSLWIVDRHYNRIFEYDVSSLFSGNGNLNATSQFDLNSENDKADGL